MTPQRVYATFLLINFSLHKKNIEKTLDFTWPVGKDYQMYFIKSDICFSIYAEAIKSLAFHLIKYTVIWNNYWSLLLAASLDTWCFAKLRICISVCILGD